jgi:hypothetical protein
VAGPAVFDCIYPEMADWLVLGVIYGFRGKGGAMTFADASTTTPVP